MQRKIPQKKLFPLISIVLLSYFCSTAAAASPEIEILTPWVQGRMILGKTVPGHQIEFKGKAIKVNQEGYFVLGLGRDEKPSLSLQAITSDGSKVQYQYEVEQRVYNEQRIEGVPKRTVNIPEEELPRIRKESASIRKARSINSDRQGFLQSFIWPSPGIITGVYGSRRIYNGEPRRPHYGVDIASPKGTIVVAPVNGQVTLVHDDMFFSGGTLIVDHGYGVSSTFIHLSEILVDVGDEVKQGQAIAKVGSTGRSTGPHLHWGMNWFNERLDPQLLVKGVPEKLPNQ